MKITTMTEALSLVPEYWPLVPGVDKWKEGDEYLYSWHEEGDNWYDVRYEWKKYEPEDLHLSGPFSVTSNYARRPIPQSIREAEARWILYMALTEPSLGGTGYVFNFCGEEGREWFDIIFTDAMGGRMFKDKDAAREAVALLGSHTEIIQMLTEGPGALWRWVAEMRGNQ